MGTLHANANYNSLDNQIDISAYADDDIGKTLINGYVSIARNYLDLDVKVEKTRLEFVESFCSSFMRNTDLRGEGNVRLAGFLSGENSINLSGRLLANGTMEITPLNTKYTLHDCTVRMVPNEIYFEQDTITDRDGNIVKQMGPVMGSALWDGSGADGERVATGIYNIYAGQGGQPSTTGTPQATVMIIK